MGNSPEDRLAIFVSYVRSIKERVGEMKQISVCVSNDLVCDNRVDKTCRSLVAYGLSVRLIGREFDNSPALPSRSYECGRVKICFKRNVLYYAELNLRLFFRLLFSRQDIIWANDLDTLLPCCLIAKFKSKPLIFDSHEHFTQVPELKANPFARKVWKMVEKYCIRKCKGVVTVCEPIREYFKEEYGVESVVVRNMPPREAATESLVPAAEKENLIVWQGAVNMERGLEELCEAMQFIDGRLVIMGEGRIKDELESKVRQYPFANKICFVGRLPFAEMMSNTRKAKLAVSIDKPTNGNYAISLPNKIFEYMASGVPMLVSPLQEIEPIVEKYEVGEFIRSYNPPELAKQINELLSDNAKADFFAANALKAAAELCWENEEKKIYELIKHTEDIK